MVEHFYLALDQCIQEQEFGERLELAAYSTLYVPMAGNLRATLTFKGRPVISDYASIVRQDREPPAIFWRENTVSLDDDTIVFETKYVTDLNQVLPSDYLGTLPRIIQRDFLRHVPQQVHDLADRLTGKETDTIKILRAFHDFVFQHLEPQSPTTDKPLSQLLDEYSRTGNFSGNCKEARSFLMALCDAKRYPTKSVYGKSAEPGGHTWPEVFVPTSDGYGLLPVDATLPCFGYHSPEDNILFEHAPDRRFDMLSSCLEEITGHPITVMYTLLLERL